MNVNDENPHIPKDVLDAERERDELWFAIDASAPNSEGYVSFPELVQYRLADTAQTACMYVDPDYIPDNPDRKPPYLGKGLRIRGNSQRYYDIVIHGDDVEEFVRRYRAHKFAHYKK